MNCFKLALLALPLSLVSSFVAKADSVVIGNTYLMTVEPYASGETNGSFYVGDTTINIYADINGHAGALLATYADAFCIDFQDEISVPATYAVVAQGVSSSTFNSALGGPSDTTLKLEAALGLQFDGSQTNDATVQEAIWDQSGANYHSSGITSALNLAASSNDSYAGAIAFEEVSHDGHADGQSFMADPAPAPTPEPSGLILLGTGLLGTVGVMRRKLHHA